MMSIHDAKQNIDHIKSFLKQGEYDMIFLTELSMCGYLFDNRND